MSRLLPQRGMYWLQSQAGSTLNHSMVISILIHSLALISIVSSRYQCNAIESNMRHLGLCVIVYWISRTWSYGIVDLSCNPEEYRASSFIVLNHESIQLAAWKHSHCNHETEISCEVYTLLLLCFLLGALDRASFLRAGCQLRDWYTCASFMIIKLNARIGSCLLNQVDSGQ